MQVSDAFQNLFIENVAASLDKQIYLWENIHHTCQWECDLERGSICFQEDMNFQIQLLGRESTENGTWVWPWADVLGNVNPEIIECALNLKRVGEQLKIPELTAPTIPLSSQFQGHIISAIASGICQSQGYYCCSAEEDCLFVLIQDANFFRKIEHPPQRIASIFPQVLTNYQIQDPKTAFIEYLKFYGLDIYLSQTKVVGTSHNADAVAAIFENEKLVKIELMKADALSNLAELEDNY